MASGQQSSEASAPILSALRSINSSIPRPQKAQAYDFLEKFQKSVSPSAYLANPYTEYKSQSEAWTVAHSILQNSAVADDARLFAATTLKGKVSRPDIKSFAPKVIADH